MSSGPTLRRQTSLCAAFAGALVAGSSCGDYDPCEAHVGALCDGVWALRPVDVSVNRAAPIDVDGDGRREWALLDLDARAVTIAWAERGRSETYRIAGQVRELAAMELDGDGVEDLALLCDRPPRLVPLYVRGGGLVEGEPILLADTPLSVVTGDLDGDDRPELLIGHDGAMTVLRGADLSVRVVEVAGAAVALDLADFDGDGALDVAALNLDGATLEVLRGDGEGGFSAMASVSLGPGPADLDLADLNGDGATDVVVRSQLGELWIIEGDGAGGLAEPWTLATGDGTGYGWSSGDVAARGVLAIPGAGSDAFAVVLPDSLLRTSVRDPSGGVVGDAGVFAERAALLLKDGLAAGYGFAYELTVGAGPSLLVGERVELGETRGGMASGELNGDGFDDIVALTEECEIEVFPGSSEGLGPAELAGAFFDRCPTILQVAEVTGDEHPDLVGGAFTPDGYEIYLAIGAEDGGFELPPPLTIEHYYGDQQPQVLRRPEGAALIFLTEPELSPLPVPVIIDVDAAGVMSVAEPELPELTQMGHGDVDGDGQEDLVLLLPLVADGVQIQVYYGVGDTFVPGPAHESLMPSPYVSSADYGELLVRDLDGDDRAELVLLSPGAVATITGLDSDLEVVDAHPVDGSLEPFLYSGTSLFADLDGDGSLDLVRLNREGIFAVRGASGGRFAAEGALLEFPESIRVTALDLEGDGRSELLVQSLDEQLRRVESHEVGLPALDQFFLLPNQWITYSIDGAVYGDFDGDGRGDVAHFGDQVLTTLWGDGGSFRRSSSRAAPSDDYSNYAAGDLDGDGRDELFAYEDRYPYQLAEVHVLRWSGDTWEIADALSVPSGISQGGLLAEDLDGDGVVDLAVSPGASRDAGVIAVYIAYGRLRADGVHELEEPVGVSVALDPEAAERPGRSPVSLSGGDLDGDGRPELLVNGSGSGSSYLLWNDGERLWSPVELPATSAAIGGVGELIVVEPDAIGRTPVYGRRLGEAVMSVHGAPSWEAFKTALLDCNGDGRPDLSVSLTFTTQLWFAVSQTFVRPLNLPQGVLFHCEDIDGDGVVDLLGIGDKGLWRLLSGGAA